MAIDLSDYTASLTRAVTPLGGSLATSITSSVLTGYLADAFWEAKLDGFMKDFTADEDGLVESTKDPVTTTTTAADGTTTTTTTEVELGRDQVAVVILYAAIGILRRQVLNTQTQFRAKAGPVEFEQQSSATMLAEMLKQLAAERARLLAIAEEEDEEAARHTFMRDVVVDRALGPTFYDLLGV